AEFAVLADLSRRIPAADRAGALAGLPADGQLPGGEAVAGQRAAWRDAVKAVDDVRDRGVDVDGLRRLGGEAVDDLAAQLRTAAATLTRREGSWTDRLGQLVRDPSWRAVWDEQVRASQRMLTELGRLTTFLAGRRVEIPDEHASQPRRLLSALGRIRERFAAGKAIRRLTQGDLFKVVTECRVDGEPMRTAEDADLVVATVERTRLRQQLAARWAEWGTRLDAPVPSAGRGSPEPELWAGRLLAEAVDALEWERRRWPSLRAGLAVALPGCPRAVDARQLTDLAALVESASAVITVDRLEAERNAMTAWLRQVTAEPGAAPVLRRLSAAWSADDPVAWDAGVAEIRRLWTVRPDAARYAALHARLSAVAPQWAAAFDRGEAPAGGEEALRAWRWRQAQTWFDAVVGGVDGADLGRRLERARDQVRRLTGDLVVSSAWLEVALMLDDRRKAALADWTAALRKIGKGTGKTAAHWQAAAQRAMAEAVTAVPVWIMSVDRALEQFPGTGPIFDVVIVDEASQADVFALPVLTLAHRAVVVGDDQQIGPQIVGVPADRINALIATHLTPVDVPSAEHFDTESSLYDHAVRRSPQRILLTEHFRSVPAIITFSSDVYYDGKIQPLRADRPLGLGPAVTAVHVPDGRRTTLPEYGEVNVPEADALVARVVAMMADPAYAGKTIGVVSLLSGSGQAAYLQHRLRADVGAAELARRELRVGDPYTFQGDERDVVLVSLVVSTADGAIGAFTKRDFHRRVNVAASRARDQMWLFHSVTVGDLHADDARALLLSYAMRPAAAEEATTDPPARLESEFQRAVWQRLTAAGLKPVPQFRLGGFRIDFVVSAPDGRRLAIECDGERFHGAEAFAQELRRQAILERVGNCVFVRLRASVFHRDPDAAMQPVWQRAEELGLVPTPHT
ncbi:MAG TPA: AAA domain-containing protein, partial [Asanoa sp.]